jgi:tyrosyl-tRNA synthetase
MFRRRQEQGADVDAHELVYPLLQGYDSFALQADLTIIGTDQLFNEMMGRWIQERLGQRPQVVLTTTITPGIDGREKQSKSLGDYIGILHSPRDKFGRVMRIPDHLVADYARVYTVMAPEQLEEVRRLSQVRPMEAKLRLATQIVRRYHGEQVAAAQPDGLPSGHMGGCSNSSVHRHPGCRERGVPCEHGCMPGARCWPCSSLCSPQWRRPPRRPPQYATSAAPRALRT